MSNHNCPHQEFPEQGKDKSRTTQKRQVFEMLSNAPATMKMVSKATGIDRANICRMVSEWRKAMQVHIYAQKPCAITKHKASYLTTNPALFPFQQQSLFN